MRKYPPGSTSSKGKMAEVLVNSMLKNGRFPPVKGRFVVSSVKDQKGQIAGQDLKADLRLRIQVKCDYKGGGKPTPDGTTGNLYLEVAEANPLRNH